MRIALLSCDDLTGYVHDDHLLVEELYQAGHTTEQVSWTQPRDWSVYDLAIIRTTWDYTKRLPEYLAFLENLERQTRLINPLATVRWNSHKGYLAELAQQGVPGIPTQLFRGSTPQPNGTAERWVVKPAVAAGGFENRVLTRAELAQFQPPTGQDWLLQPFLEEIYQGEISLFYFGGKFSHAAWKKPQAGEYRVQEEHGGRIESFAAPSELQTFGAQILKKVPHPVYYARVDLLPYQGQYLLMELELIEPSLYFRTHPQAAQNFRVAIEAQTARRS